MATQQTAETKYIVANGVKLAYRHLGLNDGIPLVSNISDELILDSILFGKLYSDFYTE
jgi:hypothetical protein